MYTNPDAQVRIANNATVCNAHASAEAESQTGTGGTSTELAHRARASHRLGIAGMGHGTASPGTGTSHLGSPPVQEACTEAPMEVLYLA